MTHEQIESIEVFALVILFTSSLVAALVFYFRLKSEQKTTAYWLQQSRKEALEKCELLQQMEIVRNSYLQRSTEKDVELVMTMIPHKTEVRSGETLVYIPISAHLPQEISDMNFPVEGYPPHAKYRLTTQAFIQLAEKIIASV